MLRRLLAVAVLALLPSLASAQDGKSKLGPDATPIFEATDFFRRAPALDYWKLAAFYLPQETSSACSVASIAMAINFVRGLPPGAEDALVTQSELLEAVGDESWAAKTVEDGDGVTFDDLLTELKAGLQAYDIGEARIDVLRPGDASTATMKKVRDYLAANEESDKDVVLAYFNQGVLTGDWDGPHISPIGAYDATKDRVLVMDVDREWYVPYWTSVPKLLEAMLKPAGAEHGPLQGETGGLVRVTAGR